MNTTKARDAENKAICKEAALLRSLLKEFGATLSGFDPGVTAYLPNKLYGNGYFGESLSFDSIEWAWLKPLLIELRELRRSNQ